MATNRIHARGTQLNLPVLANTASGDPVVVGGLVGVALTDRDADGNAVCQVGEGVYDVSVTGTIAAVGDPVFITIADYSLVVAAAAGVTLYGHALETKGSGAGVIKVRVAPYSVADPAAEQNA